jgi:hypothetical protein
LFAFAASGLLHSSGVAKTASDSSNTTSEENVLVQACNGFDVTTSYEAERTFSIVEYHTGHTVIERRQVKFAGSMGSALTGKAYAFDGHYTRTANFDQGKTSFTDLVLRFEVGTPGMFTVSIGQVGFDLVDDPPTVVRTIVPSVLRMDLCSLLAGPAPKMSGPENIDTNEPLQNFEPGQPPESCTIRPSMGQPYYCEY